ncbi:MAG: thiamine pyrophosphate-dependent enzyme, partial [Acidimicrobiales bacterium]
VGSGGRFASGELEAAGAVDTGTVPPEPPGAARQPAPDLVARLRGLLESAAAPVMVVGGRTSGLSPALVALAERYGIGVYSAFRRQDHFPNDHPAYLGHLTLAPAQETVVALRSADLVVALGCRLSEVTTQRFSLPSDRSYLVHVDPDAGGAAAADPASTPGHVRPGREPDLAIPADVGAVVASLLTGRVAPLGSDRWAGAHRAYVEDSTLPAGRAGTPLDPTSVVEVMTEVVPADAIVTNDAGNFSIALHRFWRFRFPHTQLAPTSGAMGYAVPAAVAAGLVRPSQLAVAVVGDGGYLMTGQEVETAVRYGAKVVALVVRNGLYGTIAMHQARTFGTTWGVDIGPVDIAAHARSLGAAGFTATDSASLREALVSAVGAPGPAVVDVVVDPDAITPTASLAAIASESRGRSPHGGAEGPIGTRRARVGRARTGQGGT